MRHWLALLFMQRWRQIKGELGVLCCSYLLIIRPKLYSALPENMVTSGSFNVGTLYIRPTEISGLW
jgi:hypothetical protein